MNIRTLLVALNPSKKVLMWIVTASVAAIPTVWLLSSKISTKKIMDDVRLVNLESSIGNVETKVDSLTVKFDGAEQRFNNTYKDGVEEVGRIIKESDRQQTAQIKFLVNNWSEENRTLILEALDIRQNANETKIDKMIDDVKIPYKGDPQFIPLDNEIYSVEDVDVISMDSISRNFKILYINMNPTGNYNIKYRDYTKEEIKYFK